MAVSTKPRFVGVRLLNRATRVRSISWTESFMPMALLHWPRQEATACLFRPFPIQASRGRPARPSQRAQRARTPMTGRRRSNIWLWALIGAFIGAVALAGIGPLTARAADPIKIGLGMALTGGLSANGKPALMAIQIWKDDVNKKGGLLGRPVELIFYDD